MLTMTKLKNRFRMRVNVDTGWVIRTNMYIAMALSIVFSMYVVGMDITAILSTEKIIYKKNLENGIENIDGRVR